MKLNKRVQLQEKECRIDVAENILENIKYCPGSYCDEVYDCDVTDMEWSEKQDHVLYNDEGMPVFKPHEIPDPKTGWEYYNAVKSVYSLEANKLVYDTLMAWIDGKTNR